MHSYSTPLIEIIVVAYSCSFPALTGYLFPSWHWRDPQRTFLDKYKNNATYIYKFNQFHTLKNEILMNSNCSVQIQFHAESFHSFKQKIIALSLITWICYTIKCVYIQIYLAYIHFCYLSVNCKIPKFPFSTIYMVGQ